MELLLPANTAVQEVVPAAVQRYRAAGVLTWALMHKVEAEVLAQVAATGKRSKRIIDMLRAPAALDYYPKEDRPVSFEGHEFVPIVFGAIDDAWRRVH
ncbi:MULTISPECIES: DUF2471 family protein [Burkholderiaceae]|jgi:hypothetical protein|uniref:DUF2471 family protein n=1 Tax=Burkholderiaceae TaxID=119060 RepID=UPI000665C384|nr:MULTISPECIES: hypothetical protein [Burkholderiaceae]MBR7914071.1 DUF2471 domain-containing protein [Burkholderia vietnamiensis]PRF10265.1 DUF2471 domain-containing protein [Burkholderia multivorans]USX10676.1 DUF2471 domain-containing protein [Paraburkholderia fungorum]HDR9278344.1 DUF2471 domain-containing protein [Burkholderia vietnamiensis]